MLTSRIKEPFVKLRYRNVSVTVRRNLNVFCTVSAVCCTLLQCFTAFEGTSVGSILSRGWQFHDS